MSLRRWLLVTLCLCLSLAAACLAGPLGPPTDEDQQAIEKILDESPDESALIYGLIQVLAGPRVGQAQLAVAELKQRELSANHLQALENMVHFLPFRSVASCIRMGYGEVEEVTGSWAWEVLVAQRLPEMTLNQKVEWLVENLRYDRPFGWSRADDAAQRLQKIGEPAIPRLLRVLQRDSGNAQLWAGRTLMGLRTPQAQAAVEEWALRSVEGSDDPLTWSTAAGWLEDLKSKRAVEPLVRMLAVHLEDPRCWALVSALKAIDPARAVTELRQALEECVPQEGARERNYTHICIASALAGLGEEAGRQALREAAASPIQQVRWEAAAVLLRALGPGEARPLLEKLAQDSDQDVAFRAQYALEEIDREAKAGS